MGITEAVLLIIFLILLLILFNVYVNNSKKIRQHKIDEKLKEINEQTKPEHENILNQKPSLNTGSYADEIYNYSGDIESEEESITLEEVSEDEITEPLQAIGVKKDAIENLKVNAGDEEADLAAMMFDAPINYSSSDIETDNIGAGELYGVSQSVDEDDESFTQTLVDEFKNLSPAMKTFIISNILKPKNEE